MPDAKPPKPKPSKSTAAKSAPAKSAPAKAAAGKAKSSQNTATTAPPTGSMPPGPAVGDKAPAFDLPWSAGGRVNLAELEGRKVILYFYPKDDTTGCTREALDFSAHAGDFEALGAVVIGVSPDPLASHAKFIAKHGLRVALASDENVAVAASYGVWVEKSLYGRRYMGVERATFVIGQDGRILHVWRKVKPAGHAQTVLDALRG